MAYNIWSGAGFPCKSLLGVCTISNAKSSKSKIFLVLTVFFEVTIPVKKTHRKIHNPKA
jgi:multidrug transporter EmrE-like cation transporter